MYGMDKDDTIKGGISLDTLERRATTHGFYFSSSSKRHHHHYHQHSYRRSEKGYFLKEFKTFDGEMKKSEYAEAWLLGMKKFFKLHDYLENMKAKIANSSLKGKSYICWEYVKHVRGSREEKLTWDEFERILRKKYSSERYYDGKDKELYDLTMGSMTDEEYTTKFVVVEISALSQG